MQLHVSGTTAWGGRPRQTPCCRSSRPRPACGPPVRAAGLSSPEVPELMSSMAPPLVTAHLPPASAVRLLPSSARGATPPAAAVAPASAAGAAAVAAPTTAAALAAAAAAIAPEATASAAAAAVPAGPAPPAALRSLEDALALPDAVQAGEPSLVLPSCPALEGHPWGMGLSPAAFRDALLQLPGRRQLPWASIYPPIGEGTRGAVYQATNSLTGGAMAVKVVELQQHMAGTQEAALRREALIRELQLLGCASIATSHILGMHGFSVRGLSGSSPMLEIYSELGTPLDDIITGGCGDGDGATARSVPWRQQPRDALPAAAAAAAEGPSSSSSSSRYSSGSSTGSSTSNSSSSGISSNGSTTSSGSGDGSSAAAGYCGLPMALVQKVTRHVLRGLAVLHDAGLVHRDIKSSNIVATGPKGTFKLIDLESIVPAAKVATSSSSASSSGGSQARGAGVAAALAAGPISHTTSAAPAAVAAVEATAAAAAAAAKHSQPPPLPPPQQQQQVSSAARATPIPTSLPAAAAATAAAAAAAALEVPSVMPWQATAAPAGTPENLPPEQAPTVVSRPWVLWDLLPLREGVLTAPSAAPHPSWDVWALGTVVWEMLQGEAMLREYEQPEDYYDALSQMRTTAAACPASGPAAAQALLPPLPLGLDADSREFLEACLQVLPERRASVQQLQGMRFLTNTYDNQP